MYAVCLIVVSLYTDTPPWINNEYFIAIKFQYRRVPASALIIKKLHGLLAIKSQYRFSKMVISIMNVLWWCCELIVIIVRSDLFMLYIYYLLCFNLFEYYRLNIDSWCVVIYLYIVWWFIIWSSSGLLNETNIYCMRIYFICYIDFIVCFRFAECNREIPTL